MTRKRPFIAPRPATTLAPVLALSTALFAAPLWAGGSHHETHVIKVKTDDAEMVEADVSDLALGESRSFVTDSGRTVDILRAPEGIEVYIDGELLEAEFGAEDLHERMALIHEEMEIECEADDEAECEDHFAYAWSTEDTDENVFVARKIVEISCEGDEDCDEMVWISEDGEGDFDIDFEGEGLHEEDAHKVVVIRKESREVRED